MYVAHSLGIHTHGTRVSDSDALGCGYHIEEEDVCDEEEEHLILSKE